MLPFSVNGNSILSYNIINRKPQTVLISFGVQFFPIKLNMLLIIYAIFLYMLFLQKGFYDCSNLISHSTSEAQIIPPLHFFEVPEKEVLTLPFIFCPRVFSASVFLYYIGYMGNNLLPCSATSQCYLLPTWSIALYFPKSHILSEIICTK